MDLPLKTIDISAPLFARTFKFAERQTPHAKPDDVPRCLDASWNQGRLPRNLASPSAALPSVSGGGDVESNYSLIMDRFCSLKTYDGMRYAFLIFKVNIVLQQNEHSKNGLFLQTQSPSSPINTKQSQLLQNHTRTKTYQNIPKPHLSDAWIALRPSNFDLSRETKITETRCWCKDVQSKRVIQSSTRSHLPFLGWQMSVEIKIMKPRYKFLLANTFIALCDMSVGHYAF